MEDDDGLLPLSALQHWLYCPRQCALIHVERLWAENRFTAEGRVLHETSDKPGRDKRRGVRTLTALALRSDRLKLAGVADVVELHAGVPFPVEYKRGRPKAHRADEVQLCAQGIALEEMFAVAVPAGALFYGQNRRRKDIAFDETLRALTAQVAGEAHAAIDEGRVPPPVYDRKRCDACSLIALCRPQRLAKPPRVADWLQRQLNRMDDEPSNEDKT